MCFAPIRTRTLHLGTRPFFTGSSDSTPKQPVSYTHLDVYKRQYQGRDPLREIIDEAHAHNIKVHAWFEYGFAASYGPVSYTHLDVYKRQ